MRIHHFMDFFQVRFRIRREKRSHYLRPQDSLLLKKLANRGERGVIKSRARYVVETHHRAVLWYSAASATQCTDSGKCCEIIEGKQCGESLVPLQQSLDKLISLFIARVVALNLDYQRAIDSHALLPSELLDSFPPGRTVTHRAGALDHRNVPVTESIEMLDRCSRSCTVVDYNGGIIIVGRLPSNDDRRNFEAA